MVKLEAFQCGSKVHVQGVSYQVDYLYFSHNISLKLLGKVAIWHTTDPFFLDNLMEILVYIWWVFNIPYIGQIYVVFFESRSLTIPVFYVDIYNIFEVYYFFSLANTYLLKCDIIRGNREKQWSPSVCNAFHVKYKSVKIR